MSVLDALRSPRQLTREVLAGLVVGLALIPEAIAFSIIAGVDPRVGLFGSFVMAVVTSIVGGRAALISATTGAVALVVADLAPTYGASYLVAAIILGGVFQLILAALGVAKLLRFIPRSVMTGFVNALAIIVVMSQLPHLIGVPWITYPLVALGIVVIALFPRLTTSIPAPLIGVVVVSVLVLAAGIDVATVGDQGELPHALPAFGLPDVPLTWETLRIIAPYAAGVAVVGLVESLMTSKLVDDITDTPSSKTRESAGQGIAQIASALFGGMGGCAVVGQTMMNVKISGARTRISTFLSGVFLLVLVIVFGDFVASIPMAALVAVMLMVSYAAFDWHSIRPSTLRRMPRSETAVMVVTVVLTVATENLAIGVGAGILAAAVLFVRRVAHMTRVTRTLSDDGSEARYVVEGQLLFASSNDLTTQFAYAEDPARVVIDMSRSHVWDASSVAALDAIEQKYLRRGAEVRIVGMNPASGDFHGRLTGRLP
ncbi:SulP family inorganic anion transporter [Microbacterium indicum]|uniref:SulP family inorganic anion transporter n=1 Tax=Microbacterium indicum TaxID=358100 RepID=UPI00040567C2|nr:SulP family inorganic anion transporter [Microbacterium indicum]